MEEIDNKISKLAKIVNDRNLSSPVIFLLESHKNLNGLIYNMYLFIEPFLKLFFSSKESKQIKDILQSPELIDKLILELKN